MNKFANIDAIEFAIDAGEKLSIPGGNWDFLQVDDLTPGADIVARGSSFRVPLIVGRKIKLLESEIGTVEIENRGDGKITGILYVGSGDIQDSTIVGTVSVTNAGKTRTEQEIAFLFGGGMGGVAAEYSYSYLENPAASEKNIVLNMVAMSVFSGESGSLNIFSSDDVAALEAEANFTLSTTDVLPANKKVGGAAGVAVRKGGSSSSGAPVNVSGRSTVSIVVGDSMLYRFTEPFVIAPGMAVGIRSKTVNEAVHANFEWFEEAV